MTHPEWKPDQHPDYDLWLGPQCEAECVAIQSDSAAAAEQFLRDTREVHARLYKPLTPSTHPEYAGTYRGTTGTSLEARRVFAQLHTRQGTRPFIEPHKVQPLLDGPFSKAIDELVAPRGTDNPNQLFGRAVKIFYLFGLIHPYLDGNGHIQRLAFAAAVALHPELQLGSSWTIHPRPYDQEMAIAFEQGDDALNTIAALLSPHVKR